jgi:RNA polymerase sigma-70 factor (ECF subfamily)
LFRVARNRLVTEATRRWRLSPLEPDDVATLHDQYSARAGLISSEEMPQSELARLLGSLPDRQRQVLTLTYLFEFTVAEIAVTLGMSEPAVRSMQYRARTHLRSRFSESAPTHVLRSPMRRREPRLPVLLARRLALVA